MKREERIAEAFLRSHFGLQPIHEPLGRSAPPDFCIDKTAFEARRLNENIINKDGKAEGVERTSVSLDKAVFGELEKIPFSRDAGSFYVGLKYSRPLHAKPSKIARELAKKARLYYSDGSSVRQTITASGVTAELIPASPARGKAFLRGFEFDGDSGGLVGEIYRDNIQLALQEKINKTRIVADKFDRWVLVLVDSIAPGISWADEIGEWTPDLQHFSGVVVINPDGSLAWEWPTNSLVGTP
jgi:hypothetical protein